MPFYSYSTAQKHKFPGPAPIPKSFPLLVTTENDHGPSTITFKGIYPERQKIVTQGAIVQCPENIAIAFISNLTSKASSSMEQTLCLVQEVSLMSKIFAPELSGGRNSYSYTDQNQLPCYAWVFWTPGPVNPCNLGVTPSHLYQDIQDNTGLFSWYFPSVASGIYTCRNHRHGGWLFLGNTGLVDS